MGRCPKSDGILFYIPSQKLLVSSGEGYKFDTSTPSGPHFNEKYDYSFTFTTRASTEAAIHRQPTHQTNDTVFVTKPNEPTYEAHVLDIPVDDDSEPYTLQRVDNGDILQELAEHISKTNPTNQTPQPTANTTPIPWLIDGTRVTMILPSTDNQPKQGILRLQDDQWSFYPGRRQRHPPIPLPDLAQNAQQLIDNRNLFRNWIT